MTSLNLFKQIEISKKKHMKIAFFCLCSKWSGTNSLIYTVRVNQELPFGWDRCLVRVGNALFFVGFFRSPFDTKKELFDTHSKYQKY